MRHPWLALVLLAHACSSEAPLPPADASPCEPAAVKEELEPGAHVPEGTPVTWRSNPPSSGAHYPKWLPWARVFDTPAPRGNYVHNLEHGGVALLYRCPSPPCDELADGLAAVGRSLSDPRCSPPINARWLVTQDPLLPETVEVAVAAWGWTYRAICLDAHSLRAFLVEHYAEAPENSCADGTAPVPPPDAAPPDGG